MKYKMHFPSKNDIFNFGLCQRGLTGNLSLSHPFSSCHLYLLGLTLHASYWMWIPYYAEVDMILFLRRWPLCCPCLVQEIVFLPAVFLDAMLVIKGNFRKMHQSIFFSCVPSRFTKFCCWSWIPILEDGLDAIILWQTFYLLHLELMEKYNVLDYIELMRIS